MSIRNFVRGCAAASLVALCGLTASAGVFVQPSLSGTSPSGLLWSAVATGTALPVTGTSAAAGSPGAVVYFDTITGQIQIDPKGLDLTTVIITYTTGTTNISGTTPGPFQYTSGTTTNAISPPTGAPKTFPAVAAVSGLPPTTFAARVGMTIGAPLGPSLATSGDVGNIASTSGYWNGTWAFPTDLVVSGSIGAMTISNFKTIGQSTNANANKLGYGSQQAVFQYSANGIVGNQVGAVIPVVPEPSTMALAAVGIAFAGSLDYRRRKARKQAAAAGGSANG